MTKLMRELRFVIFSREWVKMGYNVKVVHFESLFPRYYYWIGKLFKKLISQDRLCRLYEHST